MSGPEFISVQRMNARATVSDTSSLQIEPHCLRIVGALPHMHSIRFDAKARQQLREWLDAQEETT